MKQSIDDIKKDALRVLEHVISHYANEKEAVEVVAISCECDPGAASLYIHFATEDDDLMDDPMSWISSYFEQECPTYEEPVWFEEFSEMNSEYFSQEDDDESGYAEIEQYFENILEGVSSALAIIHERLVALGYRSNVKLAVMTEDDDDAEQSYTRIEKYIR